MLRKTDSMLLLCTYLTARTHIKQVMDDLNINI